MQRLRLWCRTIGLRLVHAHGETGWTARLIPLTVDGLIWSSSMVMLDSARRGMKVPALGPLALSGFVAAKQICALPKIGAVGVLKW